MDDLSTPTSTIAIAPRAPDTNSICDKRFAEQLREVQNLKQFLFEQKVKFDPTELGSIDLGPLNNLQFATTGRVPSLDEWKLLDQKISVLASYLSDDLRQKIRVRELSVFLIFFPSSFYWQRSELSCIAFYTAHS